MPCGCKKTPEQKAAEAVQRAEVRAVAQAAKQARREAALAGTTGGK